MPTADTSADAITRTSPRPDPWERAKAISSVLSAVVIPVVILIVGNVFAEAIKEREVQGKFVELAVQILREEPTKQATGLREWGTEVLNRYSGVAFSAATRQALINSTSLPTGNRGGASVGIENPALIDEYAKKLGIPPDRFQSLEGAALLNAAFFKDRESKIKELLTRNDVRGVNDQFIKRMGGHEGKIEERYNIYKSALAAAGPDATTLSVPGTKDPKWLSACVPVFLKAMRDKNIDVLVQAYALAHVEFESGECKTIR